MSRRRESTHQPIPFQPLDLVLDKALEPFEVPHSPGVEVIVRLVDKDALDVQAFDLGAILAVPVGVDFDLLAYLFDGLLAVVDGDVADGADVGEGVEFGHLADVVAAREGLGAGA